MERLLLWFLEGLAEGQGGPQARRRPGAAEADRRSASPPERRAACGP